MVGRSDFVMHDSEEEDEEEQEEEEHEHEQEQEEALPAVAREPAMTAQQALRQAEVEGLTLLRSNSKTGYRAVTIDPRCVSTPFMLRVWRGCKLVFIGSFASAEHAALVYARTPEGKACAAGLERELTWHVDDDALQQAKDERLTLPRSPRNESGYTHVYKNGQNWIARIPDGTIFVHLGTFSTREQAALAVARSQKARQDESRRGLASATPAPAPVPAPAPAPAPTPASAAATATARAAIATEQWRREEEQEQKEAQEQEQKEAQEQDEREEREAREEKKARREERKAKKEEKRAEEATAARRAQKKAREGKQAKRAAKAAAAAVPTRSEEEAKSVRKAAKRRAQEAEVDQPKKKLKKKLKRVEGLSDLVKGLPYHVHTAALAWFKKEELASVEIITECKMEDIFVAALGFNTPPPKGAEIVLRKRLADLLGGGGGGGGKPNIGYRGAGVKPFGGGGGCGGASSSSSSSSFGAGPSCASSSSAASAAARTPGGLNDVNGKALEVGQIVMIKGLQSAKATQYNHATARVTKSAVGPDQRWDVSIVDGKMKVTTLLAKGLNLVIV